MRKLFYGLLMPLCLLIGTLPVSANQIITEKYCQFKEISIYTEAYNYSEKENEAIIFLHGLGGNHLDGSFLYSPDNKYMTITMDMLNHGQSGKLDDLNWDTYVDAVKAVVDSYGLKKVHFVGHSLGADAAMMYAKKYPTDVKDIVLLDRAYYNFADVAKYNFNKAFYKIVEYSPDSGLDYNSFSTLIDMMFANDITKTWDIKKDVLLLAANPYWPAPVEGEPSIVDYIAMLKESPLDFGITPEQAAELPDLTLDNLNSYMEFLKGKIAEFTSNNKRFYMIQTPFEHAMVYNDTAKPELLKYVLEFLNNDDKDIAKGNIDKKIKEKEGTFKIRSLKDILGDNKEANDF